MKKRRTVAWLVAVAVGLMLIPAADAMGSKKSEKKQNAAIAKAAKAAAKALTRTAALSTTVGAHTKSLADLTTLANGVDTRLKVIEGAAPQIIQGLTDLKAAALALQAGLTTAGAGLTTLGDAYKAVEYGVTRIRVGPGGAGGALPFTLTSADIPDDGNTATAQGEIPVSVGPNPGQVPAGVLLSARSAIRSVEADGAATGDPAGYVGGLITMKCAGGLVANAGNCDVDTGAGVTPVPPGTILCVVGPPASQNIDVPGVGATPFNLVTIQEKAGRTDQAQPNAASPNPVAGASAGSGSVLGPLSDDTNDGCTTGDAGNLLALTVQTQFVDIPTSTTPGPKD